MTDIIFEAPTMTVSKRTLRAVFSFFVLIAVAAPQPVEAGKSMTRAEFQSMVAAANKNLPTMVDAGTQVIQVTGDFALGLIVFRSKLINYRFADFSPADLREFQSNVARQKKLSNCSDRDIRWMFDHQGLSYQYDVLSSDGKLLASTRNNKDTCRAR